MVTHFTIFLRNVELTKGQAKVLLLRHVEGLTLAFMETMVGEYKVLFCLNQLLQYVKPFGAWVMRKLFQVRQSSRESVASFVLRFKATSLEPGVDESRLREAFLDAFIHQ